MPKLKIKSPNGNISDVVLYETKSGKDKVFKIDNTNYYAYLGKPNAFNATIHRISKNGKDYAIITNNLVRIVTGPADAKFHVSVISPDDSFNDFTAGNTIEVPIGSEYTITANPWFRIANSNIPTTGILDIDTNDFVVSTAKETRFELQTTLEHHDTEQNQYIADLVRTWNPGSVNRIYGDMTPKYIADIIVFDRVSGGTFNFTLCMWGGDTVNGLFKSVTANLVYNNTNILLANMNNSDFNSTGDINVHLPFLPGTPENNLIKNICDTIDRNGSADIKIILTVNY